MDSEYIYFINNLLEGSNVFYSPIVDGIKRINTRQQSRDHDIRKANKNNLKKLTKSNMQILIKSAANIIKENQSGISIKEMQNFLDVDETTLEEIVKHFQKRVDFHLINPKGTYLSLIYIGQ